MRSLSIVFALLITATGCGASTTITIQRTVPAKYNISGIKRVVFTPFSYKTTYHKNGSTVIPKILKDHLTKKGVSEVVEAFKNYTLEMDEELPPSTIREIGRRSKADAVITGKVMAYQITTDTEEIPVDKADGCETCIGGSAEVSFFVDLVHTRTGKTLNHEYYTKIGTNRAKGGEGTEKLKGSERMLRGVTEELAKKFVLDMVPHKAREKIFFKKDKPCREGVKSAEKGDWEQARTSWNSAFSQDPNCHCALYNLGLSNEFKNNYTEAQSYYQKALGIAPKETLYIEAGKRIGRKLNEEKVLKKQPKDTTAR